jgi:hypothetical protein
MGSCGGQLKVTPTSTAAAVTARSAWVASANALWPAPPAPALKKQQDTELARIHKECAAYVASQPGW